MHTTTLTNDDNDFNRKPLLLPLPLLVLPLYIPTLIFGVAATADPAHAAEPLMLLGAVSLVSLVLAPLASASALRTLLTIVEKSVEPRGV